MSLIINSSRTTEFETFIAEAHPEVSGPSAAPGQDEALEDGFG